MYLSSIQQGIQAAHVISDMFVKYDYHDAEAEMLHDWATDHKTMILLNGGYSETLRELTQFFDNQENPYPWCAFNEGEDALDGALTSVGIVLPEKIYETTAYLRSMRFSDKEKALEEIANTGSLVVPAEVTGDDVTIRVFNRWEYQLIQKLNTFGMAS
jgi:hypothetical protein